MAKMSGGEALAKSLVREGVEVVFGIPGIHMSGSVVAMRDEPSIRIITTRNESGSTHMADGYARASGKPGVALVVPAWPPRMPALRQCSSSPAKFRVPRSAWT